MKKHPALGALARARDLRRRMTEAQEAIWAIMRSRQIGTLRFRRQVPFGRYIADFVSHEARLIIEIDGGHHDHSAVQEAQRSRFLESQGYRVLRFWDNDVLQNREGVWSVIAAELERRHPLPTLPHQGGGLAQQSSLLDESGLRLEWRCFKDFSAPELYELLRFRQAVFVVEQASPYPDLDGLDYGAEHLLLRVGDTLAGYLRLIPYPEETRVAIGRVAVGSAWRGRGLARQMMEAALARIRRDFAGWAVTLGAQTYLVPFYGSLGFRATSAPYADYGVPHVDMALCRASSAQQRLPLKPREFSYSRRADCWPN